MHNQYTKYLLNLKILFEISTSVKRIKVFDYFSDAMFYIKIDKNLGLLSKSVKIHANNNLSLT